MTTYSIDDARPAPSRLAGILAVVTLIAAIVQPVFTTLVWLFWDAFAGPASANLHGALDVTMLGMGGRLAGFCVSFVGALAGAYGLLGLRQTFLEARDRRAFSAKSLQGFRRFAWVSLFLAFYGIIQHAALFAIFSISDPSQPAGLSMRLGTPELKAIFSALLLVFVAGVFAEAKRIKDENDSFL
jgi:hypothetical protein